MKILIAGGNGQVGPALQTTLSGHDVIAADLPDIDIVIGRRLPNG